MTQFIRGRVCLSLILIATACTQPTREPSAGSATGIDSLNTRIAEAYRMHDPKAYGRLFTDTAVFEWPAFNTVRGSAALEAMARANWDGLTNMDLKLDVSTRRIGANQATEFGAFQQSFTDAKGARMIEYGRYVHFLVRDDSTGWRIDRFAGFEDSLRPRK